MEIDVKKTVNVPVSPWCGNCNRREKDAYGQDICTLHNRFLYIHKGHFLKCRECYIALQCVRGGRLMELKPCPFCGGDAKLHRREMDGLDNIYIQCKECKATSPIFARPCGVIPRREKESSPWFKPVVEAWNRRAE